MLTVSHTLTPTAPFDFAKSLAFLGEFMPSADQQTISGLQLTKALRVDGHTIGFQVTSTGRLEQPRLTVTLHSASPLPPHIEAAALNRVAFFLSITDDLRPFYALADEHLQPVIEQLYGYHQVKFLTPFENAAWSILTTRQQMSVAAKIKTDLTHACGGSITIDGHAYPAFPSPHDFLATPPDDIQQIVGNERRVTFLLSAAQAFAAADEAFLRTGPVEDVRKWLLNIKGIGPWGASFILIRALGRMNVLDVPEERLIAAASRRYGRVLSAEDVMAIAERYGDYRGYWAHYVRAAG